MQYIVVALVAILLSGCAGTPSVPESGPKIERITPEDLERLLPPQIPALSLEEIVQLSASGVAPDTIIGKIHETHSRYVLMPSQVIELHGKGVSAAVLDVMEQDQRQRVLEDMADDMNRREREHHEEIEALQRQLLVRPAYCDPYWPYPYWYHRYPYRWR